MTVWKYNVKIIMYTSFALTISLHLNPERLQQNGKGQFMLGYNFSTFINNFYFWKGVQKNTPRKNAPLKIALQKFALWKLPTAWKIALGKIPTRKIVPRKIGSQKTGLAIFLLILSYSCNFCSFLSFLYSKVYLGLLQHL